MGVCTATVLSHNLLQLFLVPPRGKRCPFLSFCVFRVWSGVFCHFFVVLLFLGSFFGKIFGSELLFLVGCVGLVFVGGFLLLFLLYSLAFRSRSCLEKFY